MLSLSQALSQWRQSKRAKNGWDPRRFSVVRFFDLLLWSRAWHRLFHANMLVPLYRRFLDPESICFVTSYLFIYRNELYKTSFTNSRFHFTSQVIQSLSICPRLVGFVMNILAKLITKQVSQICTWYPLRHEEITNLNTRTKVLL